MERSVSTALAAAFLDETKAAIDQEHRRILHCLGQLSEEEVWERPAACVNSIGIIVQHLCGNMRQWFVHGVGGAPDVRTRPSEFLDHNKRAKNELARELDTLLNEVYDVLARLDVEDLMATREIQGFPPTNILAAIYRTVTHLEGHAQQVVYISHLLLGDRYEPFWRPATPSHGA